MKFNNSAKLTIFTFLKILHYRSVDEVISCNLYEYVEERVWYVSRFPFVIK